MSFKNEVTFQHLYKDGQVRVCVKDEELNAARAAGFVVWNVADHQFPRMVYRGMESQMASTPDEYKALKGEGYADRPNKEWMNAQSGYNEVPEEKSAMVKFAVSADASRIVELEQTVAQLKALIESATAPSKFAEENAKRK